jgi:hypothetical protein
MATATAVIAGVPQLSVALDAAITLASVGNVIGLQPNAKFVVGTVNKGFSLSVTVTSCVQLAVFPETSVAVQVTVVVPIVNTAGASLVIIKSAPDEQLSAAVGVPKATAVAVHTPASAATLTLAGQVIVGFSVSLTVTLWVQVAVFPEASVTVQVTVVVPIVNTAGASLVITKSAPDEQLSVAVGVPKFTPVAVHTPASATTLTLAGQVIVGFSVSVTVTLWVQLWVLPAASVAVQVTVVVPIVNTAGASLVIIKSAPDEQLSVAVGVPKITPVAVHTPASAATLTLAGQVIVGFSLSVTVTSCVQLAVFSETSVTVQVTVVVPIGKLTGALLVTEITPQLSVVGAFPNKTPEAVHKPASAETVTFAGQLISGATVSATNVISLLIVGFGVAQDFAEYASHHTLSPTEAE